MTRVWALLFETGRNEEIAHGWMGDRNGLLSYVLGNNVHDFVVSVDATITVRTVLQESVGSVEPAACTFAVVCAMPKKGLAQRNSAPH